MYNIKHCKINLSKKTDAEQLSVVFKFDYYNLLLRFINFIYFVN